MKVNKEQNFKLFYNNRKYLLFTVLLIWLWGVLALFVIKPQYAKIKEIHREHNEKNSQLAQLQKKTRELDNILGSAEFTQKEKVDQVLPSHKPLLELLTNLNQVAKHTRVAFENFEINPGLIASPSAETEDTTLNRNRSRAAEEKRKEASSKDGYDTLEVNLRIKGKTQDVEEFMNLLEKIAPLTTITDFNISNIAAEDNKNPEQSASEAANAHGYSTASMTILTYYFTQSISVSTTEKIPTVGQEEIAVFDRIQKFMPSEFEMQDTLQSSEVEDIFGIENIIEQMK